MIGIEGEFAPDFEKAIECVGRTHGAIDKLTANHDTFVGELTELLSGAMGASKQGAKTLNYAARLHDVGKITVSPVILHAPRGLSSREREHMEKHPSMGADILRPLNTPFFDLAADIAEGHHEYADGSGYPRGLAGKNIPMCTYIVTLCDIYEALRATRSYKKDMSHEAAVKIITEGDGRGTVAMFNQRVLSVFVAIEPAFAALYENISRVK